MLKCERLSWCFAISTQHGSRLIGKKSEIVFFDLKRKNTDNGGKNCNKPWSKHCHTPNQNILVAFHHHKTTALIFFSKKAPYFRTKFTTWKSCCPLPWHHGTCTHKGGRGAALTGWRGLGRGSWAVFGETGGWWSLSDILKTRDHKPQKICWKYPDIIWISMKHLLLFFFSEKKRK